MSITGKEIKKLTAHERIIAVMTELGIDEEAIERRRNEIIGRPHNRFSLCSWSYGPGGVAGMLELVVEKMRTTAAITFGSHGRTP
jgi:hypothetical protein